MFASHGETYNDMANMSNFNDFLRDITFLIQLQKSLRYYIYITAVTHYTAVNRKY